MSHDTIVLDEDGAAPQQLPPDPSRRFWITTACAVGGVAGAATAIPFVSTFAPSAKARAAGAPVEVEVGDMVVGEMRTIEWRGKPVWIIRRTEAQMNTLPGLDSELADPNSTRTGEYPTPEYARNTWRAYDAHKDFLVVVGICTHLGCSPTPRFATGPQPNLPANWEGGFLCPCHGSTFDMSGRVFKNKPAPDNLEVPPYQYLSETRLIVGVDEDNKA